MDESNINMSLLDKVKLIEKLKKLRESEVKTKEDELSREIEDLQNKRKKEIKNLEEQLKKEETVLDEEMVKALNEMFFRDRRKYLTDRARLERKAEFIENSEESSGNAPRGESFLYSLSERIFAGENIKLQEVTNFTMYSRNKDETDRQYLGAVTLENSSYLEDLARAIGGPMDGAELYEANKQNNSDMYSRNRDSTLERLDRDMEQRRNYY